MDTAVETQIDPHGADDGEVVNPALVAASQPEVKPEWKPTEDGNQVTYGDKTYIRAEALQAERAKNQQLAKTVSQLEPLMPQFERFLQSERAGEQATVHRAAVPSDGEYTQDELTGYAITRGYYDANNQPDLKRAAQDLDIMTAIADRRAGRAVGPIAQQTAQDRARTNVQRAMSQTFVDGQPIADEQYLTAAFNAVPDEIKADPNVANILAVVAAGLQALDDRKSGKSRGARREPNFREGSGRTFSGGGEGLDALDIAAARARGKSPEQWAKMTKSAGAIGVRGDVLEEI